MSRTKLIVLVGALALLSGWYHSGTPRQKTPGAPLLAYTSIQADDADIYLTGPGNDTPVPAAHSRLYEVSPLWSPDGQWIAYTAYAASNYAARDIYTVRADLGATYNVTRSRAADYHPAWSPDGQWIAFVSDRDGNPDIYLVRPDGSDLRNLTQHPGSDDVPTWSPDGQWIAFVSNREDPSAYDSHRVFLMRADGTDVHRLTGGDTVEYTPAWSPDGQWIAFEAMRQDWQWEIYVIRADGTDRRALTDSRVLSSRPVWSPDGQWIAHFEQTDATGINRTYAVRRDGSDWHPVLDPMPYYAVMPAWSPDGRWIAVEAGAHWNGDIVLVSPLGGPARTLTASFEPHAREPRWSPDGQWIAFMVCDDPETAYDPRSGWTVRCYSHIDVYAIHPDGSKLVNLSHSAGLNQDHAWAPLASGDVTAYTGSTRPGP